jgi:Na+-translocating ferredoxin:NAD+ oxidoreductase RNF subunit RnfB
MMRSAGSVRIDASRCDGEMACLRVCPTEAIRVRRGKARILEARCIDCGECIRVCRTHAISAVTNSFEDLSRFDYTVAIPSPVLYGQFGQGATPERVLAALEKGGFDCACDLTPACEVVNAAIEEYVRQYRGPRPLISCFCPTAVRLIQVRYPELIDQVLPIESPKAILAREVRKRKARSLGIAEDRIGIIYLTPCPSELLDVMGSTGQDRSEIDGAIAMADLYRTVLSLLPIAGKWSGGERTRMSRIGLGWATLGGQTSFLRPEKCLAVDGLRNVVRILDDIEIGKMREIDFVEFHTCPDGCVSGSLLIENPYVARARILAILGQMGAQSRLSEREWKDFTGGRSLVIDRGLAAHAQGPTDLSVGRAIVRMRRLEEIQQAVPGINCGACGAPSCAAFAEDVVADEAQLTDCAFVALRQLRSKQGRVLDMPPTG